MQLPVEQAVQFVKFIYNDQLELPAPIAHVPQPAKFIGLAQLNWELAAHHVLLANVYEVLQPAHVIELFQQFEQLPTMQDWQYVKFVFV